MNNAKTIFPLFFNKARFTQSGIDRIIDVIMSETMDNCDNKPILSSKFALDVDSSCDKMEAAAYGAMSQNGLPYFKVTVKPDTYQHDASRHAGIDVDDIPF